MRSFYINGLPLPTALIEAIDSGAWRTPPDRSVWTALFAADEITSPVLDTFRYAIPIAHSWLPEPTHCYCGKAGEGVFPGDIDPNQAVEIGDLGPDRMLALDYRASLTEPRVIGLTRADPYWRLVAPNIEDFMRAIRLIA